MAGFGEEGVGFELHSLGPFARGHGGSEHGHRRLVEEGPLANLLEHVEPAESGYVEIQNEQIGAPVLPLGVFDIAHGGSAIAAYIHLKANPMRAQSFLHQDYVRKVIVGNHDSESDSRLSVGYFHG